MIKLIKTTTCIVSILVLVVSSNNSNNNYVQATMRVEKRHNIQQEEEGHGGDPLWNHRQLNPMRPSNTLLVECGGVYTESITLQRPLLGCGSLGGAYAITMDGSGSDGITLDCQGMTINGGGFAGIQAIGDVTIKNCVVTGYIKKGIHLRATSAGDELHVIDTIVGDSVNLNGAIGIGLAGVTSRAGDYKLDGVTISGENIIVGIFGVHTRKVDIINSVVTGVTEYGIFVEWSDELSVEGTTVYTTSDISSTGIFSDVPMTNIKNSMFY